MKTLLFVLATAVTAVPAAAQSALPEAYQAKPIYDRCTRLIDMRGLVNTQRLECATFDMDRADGALNAAYRVLVAHLPLAQRQRLIAGERGWIARRQATCAAAAEPNVPRDLARMWCLARETDKRTAYLLTIR